MISVIVTTYNRADLLRKNLFGYLRQTAPHLVEELIIIDDGSECRKENEKIVSDVAGCSKFHFRYMYQENAGPAVARNTAIKNAKGKLLLITGDDIVPHEDMVRQHYLAHKMRGFDEKTAVLGKISWPPDIHVTPFMEHINEMGLQFGYSIIENPNDVGFNFFYTSNISMHRALLENGDLFDTEFPYAVWEDIELSYRLSKMGLRIVYNQCAVGYHYHQISFSSFRYRQEKCGYAASIFFKKHPELKHFLKVSDNLDTLSLTNFYVPFLEKICIHLDKKSFNAPPKLYEYILNHYYLLGVQRYQINQKTLLG